MNETVASIFILFLYILVIAIFMRALMSWLPIDRNNQFARLLYTITEPLLEPVRRVMPRFGMIDLSAMVVIVVLLLMIRVVQQASS